MRTDLIQSALPYSTATVASAESLAQSSVLAVAQLLDQLEPLVGVDGAIALYARSVHLVRRAQPTALAPAAGLRAEQLHALSNDLTRHDPAAGHAIATALLTTIADVLTSLIGEPLTHRLLRSAWNLPPASAEPSEEKAN